MIANFCTSELAAASKTGILNWYSLSEMVQYTQYGLEGLIGVACCTMEKMQIAEKQYVPLVQ